ncbi:MAG: GDP-perosamine synthase [Elusimicrobia bacterium]|nr:GDP-perosamine synthase [Elusimicrobiota bacterium]
MFGAPQPRFRIYTKFSTYLRLLLDVGLLRFHRGNAIERLESTLSQILKVKHVIVTPTARTGIYLSLSSLIKPGQKVILSPITIVDVINMVICAGGVPVFADVEPNTCNIDAKEIEKLIDSHTGAVFVTHLHGLACDIKKIRDICRDRNVPLVEDAAQAFSTTVEGQWVGTFGKVGIFSFGMYKVVNAFLGGMVVTDDDQLGREIREKIKSFPPLPLKIYLKKVLHAVVTDISTAAPFFPIFTYWLFRYGFLHNIDTLNGFVTVDRVPVRKNTIPLEYLVRMSQTQARLILSQLKDVERYNRSRIKKASAYHEGLSKIPSLTIPPKRVDGSHIYTYYAFRAPDRHALMRYLLQHNRDLVLSHYHNTASLEIFKEFKRSCPHADSTARELLYLPTYPRYTETEVQENIKKIQEYFSNHQI